MRKYMKIIFSAFMCICLALSTPIFSFATESGIDTKNALSDNLLMISSKEDFLTFSENCRLDSYSNDLQVTLTTDIDLTNEDFEGIPIFNGIFDGGRHRIKGLFITDDGSSKGLFRYIGANAVVKNLIVEGSVSPDGSRSMVGGIVGTNEGLIQACTFSGTVTGADSVGGIAGTNNITGIIENCQVYGTLHGNHFVGGIVGENLGVIRNCSNLTKINTTVEENNVDISDITLDSLTSSEAAVTSTDIGGITGHNIGVIRGCENHGNIGYQHIGYNIGGIAGTHSGYIENCTNYGTIFGRKETGGIVGQMEPASTLNYDADTFQILDSQLNTLSNLTNRMHQHAKNDTAVDSSDIDTLSKEIENAQNALNRLDINNGSIDPDSILATQNTLSGSLTKILDTSTKIANANQAATDTLSSDFQAIIKHVGKISTTMNNATSHLGGSFKDVSEQDTDADTIGKVTGCINYGTVQGDLNVGGIVGTISPENDLDLENDITITGNSSMNFDYEVRAVIRNSENQGALIAKRQSAGGIVGSALLGLISDCTNTGKIDATTANYVGGIAGECHGSIRNCNVKCIISGSSYVGGIAGLASTVSDCRSMIQINEGTEKLGAILGYADKDGSYTGNYYLTVKTDLGGIDGISYESKARALSEEEFFALPNLPEMFKKQTLRFVFESGSSKNIIIDYGSRINVSDIPSVPKKEGYRGSWDGYDELISEEIVFNTTFTSVYSPLSSTVQSRDLRGNGMPILLASGDFTTTNTIKLYISPTTPSLTEGQQIVEIFKYTLPNSNTPTTMRYAYLPDYNIEEITLFVYNEETDWHPVEFTVNGSYLVFSVNKDDSAFCIIHTTPDYTFLTLTISAAVILILLITLLILCIRRNQKKRKTDMINN